MIFFFTFLSFGLLYMHRTIKILLNRKTLPEALLKESLKWQFVFLWFVILFSPWTPVPFTFFLFLIGFIAAHRLEFILNIVLRHQLEPNLLKFLDEVILLMMTGKSFKDSFRVLTQNSTHFFHIKLQELIVAGTFHHTKDNFKQFELKQFIELIHTIEKNPHKALEKLKIYRRQLHLKTTFKKKLNQASLQIKTQALVLSLLYFILLIFLLASQVQFRLSLIGLSLALFICGLLSIYYIGRNRKWKT